MIISYFGTDIIATRRACKLNDNSQEYPFYSLIENVPFENFWSSNFIILSGLDNCQKDFDQLCSCGVDPYRIRFYENIEWRRGCSFLGQYLWFGRSYYRSCVYPKGVYLDKDYSGDIKKDYEKIKASWDDILNKWRRKENTPCDGCFILKEQLWPREVELKTLSLYGGFKGECCNFKCVYCDATDNLKLANRTDSITMIEAINAFIDNNSGFSVALSAGEISISPYKKEIFALLEKNNLRASVFSNGYLFDNDIYHALENSGSINISLDSGTAKTFKRIKRIDGYFRVVENIARYSKSGGKVELKYIFLEGINDNEDDVIGFISVCKQYASSVRIACDKFRHEKRLSEKTLFYIRLMIKECQKSSIPISFSYSQFNEHDCATLRNLLMNR